MFHHFNTQHTGLDGKQRLCLQGTADLQLPVFRPLQRPTLINGPQLMACLCGGPTCTTP